MRNVKCAYAREVPFGVKCATHVADNLFINKISLTLRRQSQNCTVPLGTTALRGLPQTAFAAQAVTALCLGRNIRDEKRLIMDAPEK